MTDARARSGASEGTVVDGSRRFAEAERKRRANVLTIVGVGVTIIAVTLAVLLTPIMAVREIRIEGTSSVDPARVEQALGDLRGRPLALVSDEAVLERTSQIVQIQSVSLRREPPSRLVVEVTERIRVGALPDGDGFAVVDPVGIVLERTPTPPAGTPALDLGGGTTDSPQFKTVAQIAQQLPAELRAQIASIQARSVDDIRFTLTDGRAVVWGSAEHTDEKARALRILRERAGDDVRTYDVSSPTAPVTRTD